MLMTRATSPIAPEQLEPVLRPALEECRTLPAEAYLSDDVLAWERDRFFEASWVCLGRSADLAAPGDQRAVRAGNEGILLVRGPDGALRGFYNSCRHRGHELLEPGETRNLRAIKCPYHAWVYSLDGALSGAPRFGGIPGFDRADWPLIPARIEEWHGWVFANASGDAPPLAGHVGNLDTVVEPWEPERLVAAERHDYVVKANWKGITENYHECYHCPSIHPALCKVTPPDSGENLVQTGCWVGGTMELMDHAETMSMTGESRGIPLRGLDPKRLREVWYIGLFPNLLISLHPDYVMTHRMEPISAGETYVECEWLFAPEATGRPDFDPGYASEFWDVTNREDWGACESVQRGLASRGQRQGPFAPEEDEVHSFMAMVACGYLDGRVSTPPRIRRTSVAV
jgi:Rieske 2Fe-2S family protein